MPEFYHLKKTVPGVVCTPYFPFLSLSPLFNSIWVSTLPLMHLPTVGRFLKCSFVPLASCPQTRSWSLVQAPLLPSHCSFPPLPNSLHSKLHSYTFFSVWSLFPPVKIPVTTGQGGGPSLGPTSPILSIPPALNSALKDLKSRLPECVFHLMMLW